MAKVILRTGKVAAFTIIPLILLTVLIYGFYQINSAKADIGLSDELQRVVEPIPEPLWQEQIDMRDENTRIWQISKWIEEIDPATGKPDLVKVKSSVIEKGCGICYKDENDKFQLTDTKWRKTANGFVIDKANYALNIGNTADSILSYKKDGETLKLKADNIIVTDGVKSKVLAFVSKAKGTIDSDSPNKLIYKDAFGKGIDLELQAGADGYHQNVVFNEKLKLAKGFNKSNSKVLLSTELALDDSEESKLSLQTKDKDGKKISKKLNKAELSSFTTDEFSTESIDFVIEEEGFEPFVSHSFVDSEILTKKQDGKLSKLAVAKKKIHFDSAKKKTYLVESLDADILTDAQDIVVWDYHSVGGTLSEDEVWYSDSMYYVSSNISLSSGVTLEIEPGTIIKMGYGTQIDTTSGTLIAKGNPYEYIVFTSKYDDMAEEIDTTSSASEGDWKGINVGEGSEISFCKIAYSGYLDFTALSCRFYTTTPSKITNNILLENHNSIFINSRFTSSSSGTFEIKNNLISDTDIAIWALNMANTSSAQINILNNTIVDSDTAIRWEESEGNYHEIANNLIADCNYGINSVNAEPNGCNYNGFYNVGTKYHSYATSGANDVNCTSFPFDSNMTDLGSYFLNSDANGGDLLVDAGSGDAVDFYDDPNQWAVFHTPNDVNYFITSDITLSEDTVWQPNYSVCDFNTVDIGYHHPRVDYLLKARVTIPSGKKLTVKPGTMIAMANKTFSIRANFGSEFYANGEPFGDGYIGFYNKSLVTSNWDEIQYRGLSTPFIHNSSTDFYLSFAKLYNLREIEFFGIVATAIHDNTFKYNHTAIDFWQAGEVDVENNLFIANSTGITKYNDSSTISNNTFERNLSRAINFGFDVGAAVRNNIFIDSISGDYNDVNSATLPDAACGIFTSYSTWDEEYNAFFNNDEHIIYTDYSNYYIKDLNSTDFAGQPNDVNTTEIDINDFYLDWDDFADRFYLPQDSNLVDGGDPCSSPMYGYTTDPNTNNPTLDTDTRDIGYHYPTDTDTDSDGLYDYQEYWLGTDINDTDSDDDGLSDYDEVNIYGTDPADSDSDDDGISDGWLHPFEEKTATYDPNDFLPGTIPVDDYNCIVLPLASADSGDEINYHEVSVTFTGTGTCEISLAHSTSSDPNYAASHSHLHSSFTEVDSGEVISVISPYKAERYSWLFIYTVGDVNISSISYEYLEGNSTLYGHTGQTYNFAGRDLPYRIMFPMNYDNTKEYPLAITISGSLGVGTNNYSQMELSGLARHIFTHYLYEEDLECISIVPQIPPYDLQMPSPYHPNGVQGAPSSPEHPDWPEVNKDGWYNEACVSLINSLANSNSINVDSDRIYFTGFSYGGKTCFESMRSDPNLFAGVLCAAGWPIGQAYSNPIPDLEDELALEVEAYKSVPAWIVAGDNDTMRYGSKAAYDEMIRQGGSPLYTELSNCTHGSTGVRTFGSSTHVNWLFEQSLSGRPDLKYVINTSVEDGITIDPNGDPNYNIISSTPGFDQTFTITADPCVHTELYVDGVFQGYDVNSYTFEDVNQCHKIKVEVFEETITATADNGAAISPSGNKTITVPYSDHTFTITTDPCRHTELYIDDIFYGYDVNSYTFEDVNQSHTIHVETYDARIVRTATDYNSIQDAIDAAEANDIVEVLTGTYLGDIDFSDKSITIRSTDPNDPNVVAATILQRSDISFTDSNDSNDLVIDGITFEMPNTAITFEREDCDGSFTVKNCIIEGADWAGIECSGGSPNIINNTIETSSYGIRCVGSTPTIKGNLIYGTEASIPMPGKVYSAYAIYISDTNATIDISNNTIVDNDNGIVSVDSNDSDLQITNCIFWHNNTDLSTTGGTLSLTYSCVEDSNFLGDPNVTYNISSNPNFVNAFDFIDFTNGSGTTTTVKVADASLYSVNDVIEYDDDGMVRTVTDVNTTTDIVTFANDALSSNSEENSSIHNWGSGVTDVDADFNLTSTSPCKDTGDPNGTYTGLVDLDGENRVYNSIVDMGADEYHP